MDLQLPGVFNIRLKSFLKCWFNPISVNFLCVQQVKHNEPSGAPGPAVKESGKMISELEALMYEPFFVMLLESHPHRCEHMNIWGPVLG